MNVVLQTADRILVSFAADEMVGICNALNEVCHGIHIDDAEFATRLGVSRTFLAGLLHELNNGDRHPNQPADFRTAAWADGASVQAICVTVFGDPVDMGTDEAQRFAKELHEAVEQADA
jgi:hypothetical protein